MTKRMLVTVLVSAILGLGLAFFAGATVFLRGVPAGALSRYELYAIAFTTGVWSTMTVAFLLNHAAGRWWGLRAIGFDSGLP